MIRAFLGGCWLGELWGWLRHPRVSGLGHEWQDISVIPGCTVTVTECSRCGSSHISWERP